MKMGAKGLSLSEELCRKMNESVPLLYENRGLVMNMGN